MDYSHIDNLKNKLKNLRPLNEGEIKRLRNEFIIENTYNSNAIEGNTLTLRETALILDEGITIAQKPLREHLEAVGHRDAFEYVFSLTDVNAPLTEWEIKQIHTLVLMNDSVNKGTYRKVPVKIQGALHETAEPVTIPEKMSQLILEYESMKNKAHIIEAIAEFHLRFEGIHPFIDGNGRTGRLILNFELIKNGFLPINIKYEDRRSYYDCFDNYYETNQNPEKLISLICSYEINELEKYISILEQRS